jgi:hypothetical protein
VTIICKSRQIIIEIAWMLLMSLVLCILLAGVWVAARQGLGIALLGGLVFVIWPRRIASEREDRL